MGFLDHIRRCNRFEPNRFVRFQVADSPVGMVTREFAEALAGHPDIFEIDTLGIALKAEFTTPEARTEALDKAVRALVAEQKIPKLRGEIYPVVQEWGDEPLALIDRGAVASFGVRAFGIHVNGLRGEGERHLMWIGTRAKDKITDAGKLDNIVAGGQPAHLTLVENLVKEAAEEAGMPAGIARLAHPTSEISYRMQATDGVRRDTLFIYDLELPPDFTPHNTDGEVDHFELMEIDEVAALVRDTDRFKFNVNLVVIDFLLRSGHPAVAQDQDYARIVTGLRAQNTSTADVAAS